MSKKLFTRISKILSVTIMAASLTFAPQLTTVAQAAYAGEYYGFDLNWHESGKAQIADGYSNGDMFSSCTWRKENVRFSDGTMKLWLTNDAKRSTPYAGAEYRSNDTFGYGRYDVRMKPIKNDGVVSSFFTYTGPTDGTVWDEIDIEFLGKDTTKVQFNYYTKGVGNHEYLYNLGFDASKSFHDYSFIWEQGKITWCVDGKAVYTATRDIPTTPGKIMMNVWAGTGVDEWLNHYNGRTNICAEYDWASYTSINKYNASRNQNQGQTQNQGRTQVSNNKTYYLISKSSGKCVDLYNWSKSAGANILQWSWGKQDNQKWVLEQQSNGYYLIKNAYSNKYLDVAYASRDNGANIQQWDYNGGNQQLWKIEAVGDAYRIINVNSGKAIDISGNSKVDGGNLIQYTYKGSDNQLWYLREM